VSPFKTTDAARPPRHTRLEPLDTFVDSAHHEEIALGGPEKVQVSHFDAVIIKWGMTPRYGRSNWSKRGRGPDPAEVRVARLRERPAVSACNCVGAVSTSK
jgi:hypothetical protein